jgi:hypothetical protein
MNQITVDANLKGQLNGLNQLVEIRDADGTILGHFLPADLYQKLLHAAAETACPYSREQLEGFEKETGGKTLAEFWPELTAS